MEQIFAIFILIMGFIIISTLAIGLFLMVTSFIKKIHRKKYMALNQAVNNAIIDLYENGFLQAKGQIIKGKTKVLLLKGDEVTNPFHKEVLETVFTEGNIEVKAQDFHCRLYDARKSFYPLIQQLQGEGGIVDTVTTPKQRLLLDNVSVTGTKLIPFLILGTLEGSSRAGNPAYRSTKDYKGVNDLSSSYREKNTAAMLLAP